MAQKYRIYINEKVVLVTESEPPNKENYIEIDAEVFDLKIIYTWIVAHKNSLFYVLCNDAKTFLKTVAKNVVLIEAAGGLVKNGNDEYLFIYRHDKWDLPKGKIEKDEEIRVAAVREVEEECGIKVSYLDEKRMCKTFHVYIMKGDVVLKKTHWFKMLCKGRPKLKPQKEEGISDARWFKKNDIDTIAKNTFPLIMDVLAKEELIEAGQESRVKSQESR